MRTVKEVSKITGISVRTLHYYDEIGLLKPTLLSEAGYRLYDDKALETLQQILFFREFDMPLKEIKTVLNNPHFDRERTLNHQRQLLLLKRERLDRLIDTLDHILKGENAMDFTVFGKDDIDEMYRLMMANMEESQKDDLCRRYGSLEAFKESFVKGAATPETQKNYGKMVEWYGSKEGALEALEKMPGREVFESYQKRSQALYEKLAKELGKDIHSFEVKQIVGEMDFVTKQLYQMKDASQLMLSMADLYESNHGIKTYYDRIYGEGAAAFIADAIRAFYMH